MTNAAAPGGEVSAHDEHTFRARAGHHVPPLRLSSGRNVFEALGPGFTLMAFDADPGPWEAAGLPLTVVQDTHAGERDAYGARLILVRPDQYVAWAGDGAPADPPALLRRVIGHPRPR